MKKIKNAIFKDLDFKLIINSLLIMLSTILTCTTIGFIFNFTINKYTLIFDFIIALLIIYKIYLNDLKTSSYIIKNLLAIILIIFISAMIGIQFYDMSYDGNIYHKQLIGLLSSGLNPLFNTSIGDQWVIHYANAYEIMAAVFYSFFGNIEAGKAIDILLTIILFYNIYDFAYQISKSRVKSILISIPLALNPLFMSQFLNYYLDNIVASTLYLSIISLIKMIYLKDYKMREKTNLIIFVCSTLICINLKFQALFICGLFCLLLGSFIFIVNFINKKYKNMLRNIIIIGCTFLFGFLVIGSSSYVKNFINDGNPLYPLFGSDRVDLEEGNEPENFSQLDNRFEKWIYATLSTTSISYDDIQLKIPFFVSTDEINDLKYPDLRIGGFGVWFSGLLILSAIIAFFELIYLIKNKSKWAIILILLTVGIIFPIPFLPIVWQSRYYPQVYLLAFIYLFPLLTLKNKLPNIIFFITNFACVINVAFYIPSIFGYYEYSKKVNQELLYLAKESMYNEVILTDDQTFFYGVYYNYKDKGINYKYVYDKETIKNSTSFYHSSKYKINPNTITIKDEEDDK